MNTIRNSILKLNALSFGSKFKRPTKLRFPTHNITIRQKANTWPNNRASSLSAQYMTNTSCEIGFYTKDVASVVITTN